MNRRQDVNLSRADRAAVDAWMEADRDADAVPLEHRERARRVAGIFGLLDHLDGSIAGNPTDESAHLLSATMRRIAAAPGPEADAAAVPRAPAPEPVAPVASGTAPAVDLCREDTAALDALVAAGYDPGLVPAGHRRRADRIVRVLAALDHLPEERTGDLLAARTLRHIERSRQQERFTQQIRSLSDAGGGLGFRLRDVAAAAAMILIGVSLLWPVLSHNRATARQIACQSNLATAGLALRSYGYDHYGAMPATHARFGDPWWLTNRFDEQGNAMSNSAHLYVLARDGYVGADTLRCPENPHAAAPRDPEARDWASDEARSFSYQNQYTDRKPNLNHGPVVAILGDKNPFFEPGRYDLGLRRESNSRNHTERGQNVLLTSGEVIWLTRPLLRGNNIFHAGERGFDYYTGTEPPAHEADSFLVQ